MSLIEWATKQCSPADDKTMRLLGTSLVSGLCPVVRLKAIVKMIWVDGLVVVTDA